jgi:hypothetical protein
MPTDKERLDWLQKNHFEVAQTVRGMFYIEEVLTGESTGNYASVRSAINAAMKQFKK